MKKIIPFIIMAVAIVVANNLFAKDINAKEEAKIQAPTPAVVEAAPPKRGGCGCAH